MCLWGRVCTLPYSTQALQFELFANVMPCYTMAIKWLEVIRWVPFGDHRFASCFWNTPELAIFLLLKIASLHRWGGSPMGWWACLEVTVGGIGALVVLRQGRWKVQALLSIDQGHVSRVPKWHDFITWLGLVKLQVFSHASSPFGNSHHWLPKVEIPTYPPFLTCYII